MKYLIYIIGCLFIISGMGLYIQNNKIVPKEKTDTILNQSTKNISLLTVYDNYPSDNRLKTGWGFSCLITIDDTTMLFDTGADGKILLSNLRSLSVDPATIDLIVISHLHSDHTGGLDDIVNINPDVTVYKPTSFSSPKEIIEHIYTTGPLGNEIKEQSVVIKTDKGLLVITGCAHPGIIHILNNVKKMFPSEVIYMVLGGFHLYEASDAEINSIISDFKSHHVRKVAPSHCSGERTRQLFKQAYGNDFIENGAGKVISISLE